MNDFEEESQKNQKEDKEVLQSKTPDVGAGPVKSVADGGREGEAKQPKEHTGKLTDMGGGTGGTSGLPDASEGNDNTSPTE